MKARKIIKRGELHWKMGQKFYNCWGDLRILIKNNDGSYSFKSKNGEIYRNDWNYTKMSGARTKKYIIEMKYTWEV